ncbi:hypothetical protein SLS62_002962 [Diatrype stigma]|uniref:Flavin reductase like domain-containing protein n=1 Tax=Diatrype stigma TaxID=117547 RepID=A0AAN9YUJ8_9PEZI
MKSLRSLWRASKSESGFLPSKTYNNGNICLLCRRFSSGSGSRPGSSGLRLFTNAPRVTSQTASHGRGAYARSFTRIASSRNRDNGSMKTEDPTLPERFRAVMRQMPHPVVVITTLDCPLPHAMTGSSSSSSSSSPSPTPSSPPPPPSHWTSSDVLDSKTPSSSSSPPPDAGQQQLRPIPRAMTVSSFTSLSLRPRERVLFNIALPSRTYHAIFSSGRFNAHVLTSDEHGARIADLFTKGYGLGVGGSGDSSSGASGMGILAGLEEQGVGVLGKREWDMEWESAVSGAATTVPDSSIGDSSSSSRKFTAPLLQGPGILHVLKCDLYTPRYLDNRPPLTTNNDDQHDNFAIMLGEVTEIVHGSGDNATVEGEGGDIALAYADGAYRRPGRQVLKHAVVLPKR